MTSKLRRPPFFWGSSDNSRGLSTFSKCNTSSTSAVTKGNNKYKKMECGVAATSRLPNSNGIMTDVRSERSPSKSGLHVNFIEKTDVKEKREKFLTAKYGSHQMGLIRKRLAVEMWLYDELQKLFESPVDNYRKVRTTTPGGRPTCPGQRILTGKGTAVKGRDGEVEVDIDELLDMDSDDQRRKHLESILVDAKKSRNDVQKFVDDLLERTKTL